MLTGQMFVRWFVIICNQSTANAFSITLFRSADRFEKLPYDCDQTLDPHHLKPTILERFVNSLYL